MRSPRCLSIFLACALAFAGCEKRRDPLSSAQIFLQQVSAGKTEEAFQGAAFGFQAQRSAEAFGKAAREMGLLGYTGAQWGAPESAGREVKVPVTINTAAGRPVPLIITLLDEAGAWRVYSLRSPPNVQTGISENRFTLVGKAPMSLENIPQALPPEAEIRALARDNLLAFNEAVQAKSFEVFYESLSDAWRTGKLIKLEAMRRGKPPPEDSGLTLSQLQRAFQPFIDKQINIADIRQTEAILDPPPAVSTEGLLIVSGYYPTKPHRVHFALKFFYEVPAWKLFGLDVNLRQ